MRPPCAFAVLLALAPAALEAADGATFHNRPLRAGDVYKMITGGLFDFTMSIATEGNVLGSQEMSTRVAENYRVEVLDANALAPTRVRVRYYQSESHTSTQQGPAEKEVEPVAGETFVVTATESGPRVTDERGNPVDEKTAGQVAGDFSGLAEPDPLCKLLDGRTVALGEVLQLGPEFAGLLGASSGDDEVESFTLILREVAPRRGVRGDFELQVQLASQQIEGATMSVQAAGLVTLSVDDCRPLSVEMAGPMTIAGTSQENGQTLTLRGTGRVKAVMRLEYEP